MTTVVKMIEKQVENIEETRGCIKILTKLGHLVMQIFTELGEVFESNKVSYETVCR